jgi:hypothetical protein
LLEIAIEGSSNCMRFLVFLFVLSLLFSSEIKLSTTQSVFHPIKKSDIYFHLQYSQLSITDNFSYGAQWWPSNNLYLTGLFSNLIIEDDPSLYHHIALGYSNPDWRIKKFTTNVIEVGVHRLRYFEDKTYRWFHVGLKTRTSYKKINFGVDFTRFFYNTWATNRYTLSISKTLNDNININGGIIQDQFNSFTPYVGVSIGL